MAATETLDRYLLPRVTEALTDTRIVVIQGARQVGKSTLAESIVAERDALLVTLDDPEVRSFAAFDPTGFVDQYPEGLLVIDEIQRTPDLVVSIKAAVDRDKRPGRFLVTGSANLLDLTSTHESLAGRAESLALHSFSQGELASHPGSFVDAAFSGVRPLRYRSDLSRHEYMERACAGGYPEALSRASSRRRQDWYATYLTQIINRDAADVSGLQRLADLPRLLRLIAARSGSTMVWTALANDAGIPRRTLDPYIRLLETLFLIHVLPAWASNLTTREVKQPKIFPLDSGLTASLLGLTPAALGPTNVAAGGLLECFVVGEVRRQLGWSEQRAALYHYRDSRGLEVDLILEAPDASVVAIEVKAAATVQRKDVAGLLALRDRLGDRFVGGYVLHTGERAHSLGDRLTALPIDALWSL
ncbi:MAG TPA: ATP-binding protein [Candidatus Ruania gallistercoris]|uniref:ATP-binding protein n=1 Tax=Candidatus Ruania gallistercoris TaxID=2838746 RepID=A0A9D2EBZ6_9MICO|nr:ATP-binding protein [Candidatus Ruania gallistercoris]